MVEVLQSGRTQCTNRGVELRTALISVLAAVLAWATGLLWWWLAEGHPTSGPSVVTHAVAIGCGCLVACYVFLYCLQYRCLRHAVAIPLPEPETPLLRQAIFDGDPFTLAETLGNVAMGGADYLWAVARLDPNLVSAAERLRLPGVHGRLSLESFLSHHASAVADSGWQHRVLGYMGEQRVSDLLGNHGHMVVMASTLNQPLWDAYVDGDLVNVKTVHAVSEIKADAAAHPGITYLLPDDAQGRAVGNVVKLHGFHHDVLASHLHGAISEAILGGLLAHLPLGTVFIVGWQARANYRMGMGLSEMTAHGGVDLLFRGGGWVAGAAGGAKAGVVVGHPHVGLVLGGLAGTKAGRRIARSVRYHSVLSSEAALEQALAGYGAFYARHDVVNDLRRRLWRPIRVQEEWLRSLRSLRRNSYRGVARFWPSTESALLNATITRGRASLRASRAAVREADTILTGALWGRENPRRRLACYGLLLANLPWLAVDYGCNPDGIARVGEAEMKARAERERALDRAQERRDRRERRARSRTAKAYETLRRAWKP